MTTAPFDIPAPIIAVFVIAVAYLATVDWIHPTRHDQEQP